MKMENLNKTQIVLLTLLTSFVTSIATGIVTVTLMDQAPPYVTQTINRVINKTIQTIVPGERKVTTVIKKIIVNEKDLVVGVVEKASKSLVQVSATDKDGKNIPLSLGVVVSKDGIIITDKKRIEGNRNNLIISEYGKTMRAKVLSEENDFIVLRAVKSTNATTTKDKEDVKNNNINLTPISLLSPDNVKLGQTIIALGGEDGRTVLTGIVSRLDLETNIAPIEVGNPTKKTNKDSKITKSKDVLKYIVPSFEITKKGVGGPTLDMDGNLIGVNVITNDGKILSIPTNAIEKALYNIANPTKSISTGDKNINIKSATSSNSLTKSK